MAKKVAIAEEPDEQRDEAIFALRLTGKSERLTARQFGVSPKYVRDVVARLCLRVDPETRAEELRLELSRLSRVGEKFYDLALKGDPIAANVLIRLGEYKSSLWAWSYAPRRDVLVTIEQAPPRPGSTDRIRAALDAIARREPETIEAEVIPEPAS